MKRVLWLFIEHGGLPYWVVWPVPSHESYRGTAFDVFEVVAYYQAVLSYRTQNLACCYQENMVTNHNNRMS